MDNGYYEFSKIESFYKMNTIINFVLNEIDYPELKLNKSNNIFQPFGKGSLLNRILLETSRENPSKYLKFIINQFVNWKSLKSKFCNIYCMFYGCSSLESLPNISKWNIENIIDISGLFYKCSSLKYIPDISKWDISNVKNMSGLFYKCSSLEELPDISKWNTSNILYMVGLFGRCSSLKLLPDISNWNVSKANSFYGMFYGCSNLQSLPDKEYIFI